MENKMRLNKYLAQALGVSRRNADVLIAEGRVKLDGQTVKQLATAVDAQNIVEFDGKRISLTTEKYYYALNKPAGYTSTRADAHAAHTVIELLPPDEHLFPVGRLDRDSRGLLLLTNDGDFAYRLTHPKFGCEKEYLVTIESKYDQRAQISTKLKQLARGVVIDSRRTSEAQVSEPQAMGSQTWQFRITLQEGRNRQIRKMVQSVNWQVKDLQRIRIGHLNLGHLAEGKWRRIKPQDVI